MKKLIIIITLIAGCMQMLWAGNVKIIGTMKAYKASNFEMYPEIMSSDIYKSGKIVVNADSTGHFKIELNLTKPAYYKFAQNRIYLSPGDNIDIDLNRATLRTTYSGTGSDCDNYMKGIARLSSIAKLSTWAVAIYKTKPLTYTEYKAKIDSAANVLSLRLSGLSSNKLFHSNELIRIEALRLSSYLDYYIFGFLSEYKDSPEVKLKKKLDFYTSIKSDIEPLLKILTSSDSYLDMPEVREALTECNSTKVFQFHHSSIFLELMTALEKSPLLDRGVTKSSYEQYMKYAKSIKNQELQTAFISKLEKRNQLIAGRLASDLTVEDFEGNKVKISSFKGKPIFIDFWATWCLPCLAQMPHFEELSKAYPEIQFIGVSIDQIASSWRDRLKKSGIPATVKEFLVDPFVVEKAWDLASIPRFILIDKDFKIVNAFAPRPSDKEAITKLLDEIKNKK
jgi:thiol-disulfide isomerase/thioredoxin